MALTGRTACSVFRECAPWLKGAWPAAEATPEPCCDERWRNTGVNGFKRRNSLRNLGGTTEPPSHTWGGGLFY